MYAFFMLFRSLTSVMAFQRLTVADKRGFQCEWQPCCLRHPVCHGKYTKLTAATNISHCEGTSSWQELCYCSCVQSQE